MMSMMNLNMVTDEERDWHMDDPDEPDSNDEADGSKWEESKQPKGQSEGRSSMLVTWPFFRPEQLTVLSVALKQVSVLVFRRIDV